MKNLTIVRHAKSSWASATLDDFQRPLNERGLRDSVTMAKRLLAHHLLPQHIVSSPALRAITTAQRLADILGLSASAISTDSTIYEASNDTLHDVVWGLSDEYDDIMLVGHNPGLSDLLRSLSAGMVDELVTCAVVRLQFDCDAWHNIDLHAGKVQFSDYPKSHKEG